MAWDTVTNALTYRGNPGGTGARQQRQQQRQQQQRQDQRQQQRQDRRRVGTPQRNPYKVQVTPGTTQPTNGFLNGQNTDTRDQTWDQWQQTVSALGGSPMTYTEYAQANNGLGAMPTEVNGIPLIIPQGVAALSGPTTATGTASFGTAPANTTTPTVVQEWGTPGKGYRGQGPGGRRDRRAGR